MPAMSSSGLVRVGPVRGLHEAPLVGVVTRVPAVTLLIAVLAVRLNVTLTVSPVTTRDRDAVSELNLPCALTPGAKTSAPPWFVAAV